MYPQRRNMRRKQRRVRFTQQIIFDDIVQRGDQHDLMQFLNSTHHHFQVDVNKRNKRGNLPLAEFIRRDAIDSVRVLLNLGVDINQNDSKGWTSLHYAVYYHTPRIVKHLLERGADPDIPDALNIKPADISEDFEIIELMTLFSTRESPAPTIYSPQHEIQRDKSKMESNYQNKESPRRNGSPFEKENIDQKTNNSDLKINEIYSHGIESPPKSVSPRRNESPLRNSYLKRSESPLKTILSSNNKDNLSELKKSNSVESVFQPKSLLRPHSPIFEPRKHSRLKFDSEKRGMDEFLPHNKRWSLPLDYESHSSEYYARRTPTTRRKTLTPHVHGEFCACVL